MPDITIVEVEVPGQQGAGPGVFETVSAASYAPVFLDRLKTKRFTSATAVTVTMPSVFAGAVAIPDGFQMGFGQYGTGQLTFVEGAGVGAFITRFAKKTAGQYAVVTAIWDATALTWWLVGDTADA